MKKHWKVIIGIIVAGAAVWLITDMAKRRTIPEYDDYMKVEDTEYIANKNDCSNMVAALYWDYTEKGVEAEVQAYDIGEPYGHAVLYLPEKGIYLDPAGRTVRARIPDTWKLKWIVSEEELLLNPDWRPTEVEK